MEKRTSKDKDFSNIDKNNLLNTKYKEIHLEIGETDRQNYLNKEEAKDIRKFPFEKFGVMLMFYLLMILINLLKGTKDFESIIHIQMYFIK